MELCSGGESVPADPEEVVVEEKRLQILPVVGTEEPARPPWYGSVEDLACRNLLTETTVQTTNVPDDLPRRHIPDPVKMLAPVQCLGVLAHWTEMK